jgi:hypothetical protein
MKNSNNKNLFLYRIEYYEDLDQEVYTDWVWLKEEELEDYISQYEFVKSRPATPLEMDLYDYAYGDGYDIAMVQEQHSSYNGITFRLNSMNLVEKDGTSGIDTTKMFQCGVCNGHLDFEDNVATANGFFVSIEKENVLWHVCYDCAISEIKENIEGDSGGHREF